MGTFSASDHSGVFSILGGLCLLILVAAGASLVLEGSLGSKEETTLLERETALMEGRAKIRKIRGQLSELEVQRIIQEKSEQNLSNLPRLKKGIKERMTLTEGLEKESKQLRADIVSVQDQWLDYRHKRRKIARLKMMGNFLGELTLVSGRTYRKVTVVKVEASGIAIRHATGRTRVPVSQIPIDLRLELDLTLEEAEDAVKEERRQEELRRKKIAAVVAARKKAEDRASDPSSNPELANKRILEGRQRIDKLVRKMFAAKSEASRARSNHAFSSKRSVPGSLESWYDRAKRMERAAVKYREQIDRVVRKVQNLDPHYTPPALD